jgi:hypothetical protein
MPTLPLTFNFFDACLRCMRTVETEIPKRGAISLSIISTDTRSAISRSRADKLLMRRAGSGDGRGGLLIAVF